MGKAGFSQDNIFISTSRGMYIYDIDTKEMITVKDDNRCNAVYVAENYIIAYYVSEEGNTFKFFNDEGEYLDFEIAY